MIHWLAHKDSSKVQISYLKRWLKLSSSTRSQLNPLFNIPAKCSSRCFLYSSNVRKVYQHALSLGHYWLLERSFIPTLRKKLSPCSCHTRFTTKSLMPAHQIWKNWGSYLIRILFIFCPDIFTSFTYLSSYDLVSVMIIVISTFPSKFTYKPSMPGNKYIWFQLISHWTLEVGIINPMIELRKLTKQSGSG